MGKVVKTVNFLLDMGKITLELICATLKQVGPCKPNWDMGNFSWDIWILPLSNVSLAGILGYGSIESGILGYGSIEIGILGYGFIEIGIFRISRPPLTQPYKS